MRRTSAGALAWVRQAGGVLLLLLLFAVAFAAAAVIVGVGQGCATTAAGGSLSDGLEDAAIEAADCTANAAILCTANALVTCSRPSVAGGGPAWLAYAECLGELAGDCGAGQAAVCGLAAVMTMSGAGSAHGAVPGLGVTHGALAGAGVDVDREAIAECVIASDCAAGPSVAACAVTVRTCLHQQLGSTP